MSLCGAFLPRGRRKNSQDCVRRDTFCTLSIIGLLTVQDDELGFGRDWIADPVLGHALELGLAFAVTLLARGLYPQDGSAGEVVDEVPGGQRREVVGRSAVTFGCGRQGWPPRGRRGSSGGQRGRAVTLESLGIRLLTLSECTGVCFHFSSR